MKNNKRILSYVLIIIIILFLINNRYSDYKVRKTLEVIEKFNSIELFSNSQLIKKYSYLDSYKNIGIIFADNKSNNRINRIDKSLIGYLKFLKDEELLEECKIYFIKELTTDIPFLYDYKYDTIILAKMKGKYFTLSQEIYDDIVKNNMLDE